MACGNRGFKQTAEAMAAHAGSRSGRTALGDCATFAELFIGNDDGTTGADVGAPTTHSAARALE